MVKLLGNRVLIKPAQAEDVTKSGIIILESGKEAPNKGVVDNVGDDCVSVKIGDKVLFEARAFKEIKVGVENVLLGNETNVIAII